MKPWVKYTVLRLGIFLVALVLFVLLLPNPYLATLLAAVVAFCVSYIFFAGLRREVALELADRRSRPEPLDRDTLAEDDDLAEQDARLAEADAAPAAPDDAGSRPADDRPEGPARGA
ncbi:DUF4229 domain-containing protein [Frigoribacterium sp. NBH87]|uniref:DUF4229 domain-containing protein n=1 Tax=Frigoribacterium sp. NBH87 TaxID=2596916 RepID=UPI001628C89F|nr:DUF4229 domain-containing protein [Frigoribacterium sp. NBH87]QNE44663.1 DUF4229 domain-containing protein [Frigoribacterium sp. NBH87]